MSLRWDGDVYSLSLQEVTFWCFTGCHYEKYCMIVSVQQMMIYINTRVHQRVHPSACALLHCATARLKCRTLCIQMQHCSFICWVFCRGHPMTGDQCMADRGQIDLTSVFLSLSTARCLSHLAWRTRGMRAACVCAPSVHTWARQKRQALSEAGWGVDRLYWTICHRPGRGEKRQVGGGGGEGDGEGGCILMVSLRNKQLDAGSEWDGLSVEADIKWWAVRLVLFFLINKSTSWMLCFL